MGKATLAAVGLAALSLANVAFAEDALYYTYLEPNYLNGTLDDYGPFGAKLEGDGLGFQGAMRITGRIHGYLEYQDRDFGIDIQDVRSHVGTEIWEAGVGLNWPLEWDLVSRFASTIDLIGRVAYLRANADVDDVNDLIEDEGYALQVGVRALLSKDIELEGLAHRTDLSGSGSGTTYRLSGRYRVTKFLTATAGMELSSNSTLGIVGIRVNFPR
jgi:hypothetical protein